MIIIKWKEEGVFERENSYMLFGDNSDRFPQVLPKSVLDHVVFDNDSYTFNVPDWLIEKEFDFKIDDRLKNLYGNRFNKLKQSKRCISIEKV